MTRELKIAASAMQETDLDTGKVGWRGRIDMMGRHWPDSAEALWVSDELYDTEDEAQADAEDNFDAIEGDHVWNALRYAFELYFGELPQGG